MGEKLTESITVKLSPTEMHQLKCLAAEEGLSWAEYMRGLLAPEITGGHWPSAWIDGLEPNNKVKI